MSRRFIPRLVALGPLWEAWSESKQGKGGERLGELRVAAAVPMLSLTSTDALKLPLGNAFQSIFPFFARLSA